VDAHRQAINNSTFQNEQDIGKAAVSEWTYDYNKKHAGREQAVLVYRKKASMCLHNC
jgi:hypothetical protein